MTKENPTGTGTFNFTGNEVLTGNLQAAGLTDGTTTKTMADILASGKLYTTTGQNTDGPMSQKATTDELAKKVQFIEDTTGSADPSPLDDYYNKSQLDTLLNQKANASLNNISPNLTSSSFTLINKSGTKYSGAHIVIESWKATDSSAWYRIYNDGFKECGGRINGSGTFGYYTTNFPTTFLTSNYSIVVTGF